MLAKRFSRLAESLVFDEIVEQRMNDLSTPHPARTGYILKRYPRYSETFVVNEILAHEAAGHSVEIFSLLPPSDSHFQDLISRVRAPVTWVAAEGLRAPEFWAAVKAAALVFPGLFAALSVGRDEDPRHVYQALRIATLARERGVTHLHAHFATSATCVARLASKFTGIPYSFTAHAKDIFHESVSFEDLTKKLEDAAAVVTVSDFNVAYLRERYGKSADTLERIFNGLDLQEFPWSAPVNRARRIISVGRLVEKKGFCDLVDACAILQAEAVDFECLIIGTGEFEAAIRQQITDLGLSSAVRMLGARPRREVIDLVSSSAVFAGPYVIGSDGNRDGLPTVLVEAMALGTPCVATDVTAVPEVIEDRVTGLLVPQRDPAALARGMRMLLDDPQLGQTLSVNARSRIERDFDLATNARALRAVFERAGRRHHATDPD